MVDELTSLELEKKKNEKDVIDLTMMDKTAKKAKQNKKQNGRNRKSPAEVLDDIIKKGKILIDLLSKKDYNELLDEQQKHIYNYQQFLDVRSKHPKKRTKQTKIKPTEIPLLEFNNINNQQHQPMLQLIPDSISDSPPIDDSMNMAKVLEQPELKQSSSVNDVNSNSKKNPNLVHCEHCSVEKFLVDWTQFFQCCYKNRKKVNGEWVGCTGSNLHNITNVFKLRLESAASQQQFGPGSQSKAVTKNIKNYLIQEIVRHLKRYDSINSQNYRSVLNQLQPIEQMSQSVQQELKQIEYPSSNVIPCTRLPQAVDVVFKCAGENICSKCWRSIHNVRERTFQDAFRDVVNGKKSHIHKNTRIREDTRLNQAIEFLSKYSQENCQYMPHVLQWQMENTTWKSAYHDINQAYYQQNRQTFSASTWRRARMNKLHSHLVLKRRNGLGRCDVCCNLDTELERMSKSNAPGIESVLRRKQAHIQQQKAQRAAAWSKKELCERPESGCCQIWLDGMDQNKGLKPSFLHPGKALQQLDAKRIKIKIQGLLVFGAPKPYCNFAYLCPPHLMGDANLGIHCLHQTIKKILNAFKPHQKRPDTLYLQMDNASRDNKVSIKSWN